MLDLTLNYLKKAIEADLRYSLTSLTCLVEVLSDMSVEYEPLGVNRRRNPNVSAEILGGFSAGPGAAVPGSGSRYAIVTLDGTIMLVDNCDKPPMESIM